MSRQIEQALLSLMPSHGSDLPPSLAELAESLLAQSRHRASTLKAEEEVARLYACAHIACDRLKTTLDLPPIQARPPIPPRIYNRLYAHLDNILPGASTPSRLRSTRTTRTPNSRTRNELGSEPRPLPTRGTPTKEQSLAPFRKASATKPPPSINGTLAAGIGLPPWAKPVIRFICSETHQPQLGSTVVAGMDAIVAPFGRRTDDPWINQNITALLAAVYFFVTIRVVALVKDQPMTKEPFALQRREMLRLLEQARAEIEVNAAEGSDPWAEWQEVKPRDFNSAVTQLEEQGWLLTDWFKGIDDVIQPKDGSKIQVEGDGEDLDLVVPTQARRSDAMFQDKYDYLSEARQADYTVWKSEMLQRISHMAASTTSTAMDIDVP